MQACSAFAIIFRFRYVTHDAIKNESKPNWLDILMIIMNWTRIFNSASPCMQLYQTIVHTHTQLKCAAPNQMRVREKTKQNKNEVTTHLIIQFQSCFFVSFVYCGSWLYRMCTGLSWVSHVSAPTRKTEFYMMSAHDFTFVLICAIVIVIAFALDYNLHTLRQVPLQRLVRLFMEIFWNINYKSSYCHAWHTHTAIYRWPHSANLKCIHRFCNWKWEITIKYYDFRYVSKYIEKWWCNCTQSKWDHFKWMAINPTNELIFAFALDRTSMHFLCLVNLFE